MIVQDIYCNTNDSLVVPSKMGEPKEHHLKGTVADNLIELCGRVCYDSLKQERSRSSEDYHKHIIEVNHGSVQEHVNITIRINIDNPKDIFIDLINKPGLYARLIDDHHVQITANIRTIREWNGNQDIGDCLKSYASSVAPLATQDIDLLSLRSVFIPHSELITDPNQLDDEETWYSFFISDVSRGLTHELVRHKWRTAVSQRSTRYVDESKSAWSFHPLLDYYKTNRDSFISKIGTLTTTPGIQPYYSLEAVSREMYDDVVKNLQSSLVENGIDKFTARKQARGAARGILGNALSTELIFSASVAQWKRIIQQRGNRHADAEIRLLANEVFNILKEEHFPNYNIGTCPDGVGFEVTIL